MNDAMFWVYAAPILAAFAAVCVWQGDRLAGWFGLGDESDDSARSILAVAVVVIALVALLGWNLTARGFSAPPAAVTTSPVAIPAETTSSSAAPMTGTTAVLAPSPVVDLPTEKDARSFKSARPEVTGRVLSPGEWSAMADCESGEWDANKHPVAGTARWDDQRGGYEGGLHFLHSTWVRAGGRVFAEHAYEATRDEQIEVAGDWLARTDLRQWPKCSQKIGVR